MVTGQIIHSLDQLLRTTTAKTTMAFRNFNIFNYMTKSALLECTRDDIEMIARETYFQTEEEWQAFLFVKEYVDEVTRIKPYLTHQDRKRPRDYYTEEDACNPKRQRVESDDEDLESDGEGGKWVREEEAEKQPWEVTEYQPEVFDLEEEDYGDYDYRQEDFEDEPVATFSVEYDSDDSFEPLIVVKESLNDKIIRVAVKSDFKKKEIANIGWMRGDHERVKTKEDLRVYAKELAEKDDPSDFAAGVYWLNCFINKEKIFNDDKYCGLCNQGRYFMEKYIDTSITFPNKMKLDTVCGRCNQLNKQMETTKFYACESLRFH
uniref:ORF7 n=1 Tax=Malaco herpesvirus 1 TaxID=3031797 RepID=A0AA48P7Q8_9VIRU|nr:TPA_asm: ORF7 [Malaco herpesvirus 1]